MKRLAEARHRTSHWRCVKQHIEREDKREAFRQNSSRAWNNFQATGLHVTLEETDTWLAKLEAGQDVEPPECQA